MNSAIYKAKEAESIFNIKLYYVNFVIIQCYDAKKVHTKLSILQTYRSALKRLIKISIPYFLLLLSLQPDSRSHRISRVSIRNKSNPRTFNWFRPLKYRFFSTYNFVVIVSKLVQLHSFCCIAFFS